MAPEIIKKLPYDCTVDIWALGVLTYIMLSGKPPFKGRSKDEVFIEITTKNITYSGETWKNISKEAKNFVRKMLVRDPKQRSTAEDLIKDEFLVNNVEQGDIKESVLLDITNNLR
jgi:serine/threonine protein kinase